MRVAVDARELCGKPTGVGRYLTGLFDAWAAGDALRRHQFTLIAHQPIAAASRWPAAVRIAAGSGGTAWEQTALRRAVGAEHADVFFAPGYTAPLTVPTPLVLTIHDVSYFAHPEWFSWREGLRRRFLTRWSARRARAVITDTEFSRSEIARHVGVDAHVVPLGVDRPDQGPDAPADGRAPIVLFVGSLFQRRRVDRLIEAFGTVAAMVPEARLEIVGENRTRPHIDFAALARKTGHADRISIRSYVDDATLRALYDEASVFAFLSEYEGFGLTPLEALANGVPPVLLDTAVARETCGEAARYVAPTATPADLAGALVTLLTDASARSAVLRHRDAVFARLDWGRCAAATLQILEEAARGR
jgi:glycosyltransferase involved in cell wall biosynthesis